MFKKSYEVCRVTPLTPQFTYEIIITQSEGHFVVSVIAPDEKTAIRLAEHGHYRFASPFYPKS